MTQHRDVVTVVGVTYVLNSTGASPVTFRFSDRPFTDRSAGWVAEASLLEVPGITLSRTSGTNLRRATTPMGSDVRVAPSVATRQALAARNCERQALDVWRVDRSVETLVGVTPVFIGLCEESDWSDADLLIRPFPLDKLFEAPVQPACWPGRGAAVRFADTATTSSPGYVEILEPSADYWDVATAITVEAGFYATDLTPFGQHAAVVDRGDEWLLGLDVTNADELTFFYGATSGAVKASSGLVPTLNQRYHVAGQWDGTQVRAGYDGAWTGSPTAETNLPTNVNEDIWIGGSKAAAFVGNPLRGAVDFIRIWIDYVPTWQEMERYANRSVPPRLQGFVVLEMLLNEGLGTIVYDNDRSIEGRFARAKTTWEPTNTADAHLKGKRKPWTLGYVPNAPAELIHKVFQRYSVNGGEIEAVIPKSGGRRMQKSLSWASLTLSFDADDQTIKDHRSGNTEWAELLAGAIVRVTGTTSNNTDYRLERDAFQVGNFYFLKLVETPVTEASVVSTVIETITDKRAETLSTGTVDFSNADGTITAKTGQNFAAFERYGLLSIAGSASNDGTGNFVLETDPYVNGSGEWVLLVSPPPTTTVGDAAVTVSQDADIGEYQVAAADDVLGQVGLNFEPTKAMSAEVYGSVTAGSTPLTAAEQLKWILDNGPAAVQAIPYSAGRLATMARKFPALSGVAQGLGEVLTIAQVRDILAQTMGAHAWISPRTGSFEVLDWPFVARNPIPIDQAFLSSFGATGDAADLGDDPDSGIATDVGVVLSSVTFVAYIYAEIDQVERPYVDSFLVRIAVKASKNTVTMQVKATENLTVKKALGINEEVGTTETVYEYTLDTDDLTDDSGGNTLAIYIENTENDGSTLTVGAVEFVPTWKITEIGPEDVFEFNPEPSVPGAGATQVLYSRNKVKLSAGDIALPVLADRSSAGREALERVTHDFLVASHPDIIDDEADLMTLETALVNGEDAEELAEAVFAGSGTNTFFELRIASALLENVDPFFQLVRFSSGWQGILSGVTDDDVDVVALDEGELETRLAVVLVGRVL